MDDDRMSMSSDDSSDLYDAPERLDATHATLTQQELKNTLPTNEYSLNSSNDAQHSAPVVGYETSAPHKPRPSPAARRLSPGLWQRIFSYLPPPTLGRLMVVNKAFKSYLDGTVPPGIVSDKDSVRTMDTESLWSIWRTVHVPNMPKPLQGMTERDMWKMMRGFRCEMCDKLDELPRHSNITDIWHGGPRMSTTRAIWPFGGRFCAECCFRACEKDTKLLCTPVKSFMSALPYAFFTHDWHYVPTNIVKEAGSPPQGVHITKQFWRIHAEQILEEYAETQKLGAPAAEEWTKGLAGMGRVTMDDAARWERWEMKNGLQYLHALLTPPPPPLPISQEPANTSQYWSQGAPVQSLDSLTQFHQPQPVSMAQMAGPYIASGTPTAFQTSPVSLGPSPFPQPNNMSPSYGPGYAPYPQFSPHPVGQMQPPVQRMERNVKDAQAAKESRRKTIEDRAFRELNILPNVLRHMDSFQAAVQISTPMTDSAWELLKPRLLAQREIAEHFEHENTAQLLALQAQNDPQNKRSVHSKDAKEAQDRDWEEALKPQRARLSEYADNHVRNDWQGGRSINNGIVARFAISLLNTVYDQFYAALAVDDVVVQSSGHHIRYDPPDGPFLRRLTLETMKWVYDHKIRPLTRDFGKEIFFCSGEGCEGNNKFYAYEGAIQHFGAKHTNSFSKGNVIVHWQSADWPEELPFFDPGSGPVWSNPNNGGLSRPNTITPQIHSGAFMAPPSNGGFPGQIPPSTPNHGSLAPQNSTVGRSKPAMHDAREVRPTAMQSSGQSYDKYDLSQLFKGALNGSRSAATSPVSGMAPSLGNMTLMNEGTSTHQGPHSGTVPPMDPKPHFFDADMPDFGVYQDQLKYVAESARFAWNHTSAILDLPQSVRVFAIIHHAVSQFSSRFKVELSLETFTAALTNNALLESLKAVDHLVCRVCRGSSAGLASDFPSNIITGDMDLTHLISHFQTIHVDGTSASTSSNLRRNWATEMIVLPDDDVISDLINAAGMNDEKLVVLSDAFPTLLPRRMVRNKDTGDRRRGKVARQHERQFSGTQRLKAEDRRDSSESSHSSLWDSPNTHSGEYGNISASQQVRERVGTYSRGRTPQMYGDDNDQYDPENPALVVKSNHRTRKQNGKHARGLSDQFKHDERERAHKRSAPDTDLAALLNSATESAVRAAEEENRRRGIKPRTSTPLNAAYAETYQPSSVGQASQTWQGVPESRFISDRPSATYNVQSVEPVVSSLERSSRIRAPIGNVVDVDMYGESHSHAVPSKHSAWDHQALTQSNGEPAARSRSGLLAQYEGIRGLDSRNRSRSPQRYDGPLDTTDPQRDFLRRRDYPYIRGDLDGVNDVSPSAYVLHDRQEPLYVDEYGRQVRIVGRVDEGARSQHRGPPQEEQVIEYVRRRPPGDNRAFHMYYDDL